MFGEDLIWRLVYTGWEDWQKKVVKTADSLDTIDKKMQSTQRHIDVLSKKNLTLGLTDEIANVKALEAKIVSLTAKHSAYASKVNTMQASGQSTRGFSSQLSKIKNELASVQTAFESARLELPNTNIDAYVKHMGYLEDKVVDVKREIRLLSKEKFRIAGGFSKEIVQARVEVGSLQKEIKSLDKKRSGPEFSKNMKEAKSDLAALQKEINSISKQKVNFAPDWESQVATKRIGVKSLKSDISKMEKEGAGWEKQVAAKTARIEALKSEIHSMVQSGDAKYVNSVSSQLKSRQDELLQFQTALKGMPSVTSKNFKAGQTLPTVTSAKRYKFLASSASDLKREESQYTTLGMQARRTASDVGSVSTQLGIAGIAGAGFLASAGMNAAHFSKRMAEVNSLMNYTPKEAEAAKKGVENIFRNVPVKDMDNLVEGLYDVASSGVKADDSMGVLALAAKAAAAGQTDLSVATKAGLATLHAFNRPMSDLNHIYDLQFKLVDRGIGRYKDFQISIARAETAARFAGQSIETTYATIAALTKVGFSPRMAIFTTARTMADLVVKRPKIKEFTGIDVVDKSTGKMKGLVDIVKELRAKIDSGAVSMTQLHQAAENDRTLQGFVALAGSIQMYSKEYETQFLNSAGTMERAFKKATDNTEDRINLAKQNIILAFKKIGESSAITSVFEKISGAAVTAEKIVNEKNASWISSVVAWGSAITLAAAGAGHAYSIISRGAGVFFSVAGAAKTMQLAKIAFEMKTLTGAMSVASAGASGLGLSATGASLGIVALYAALVLVASAIAYFGFKKLDDWLNKDIYKAREAGNAQIALATQFRLVGSATESNTLAYKKKEEILNRLAGQYPDLVQKVRSGKMAMNEFADAVEKAGASMADLRTQSETIIDFWLFGGRGGRAATPLGSDPKLFEKYKTELSSLTAAKDKYFKTGKGGATIGQIISTKTSLANVSPESQETQKRILDLFKSIGAGSSVSGLSRNISSKELDKTILQLKRWQTSALGGERAGLTSDVSTLTGIKDKLKGKTVTAGEISSLVSDPGSKKRIEDALHIRRVLSKVDYDTVVSGKQFAKAIQSARRQATSGLLDDADKLGKSLLGESYGFSSGDIIKTRLQANKAVQKLILSGLNPNDAKFAVAGNLATDSASYKQVYNKAIEASAGYCARAIDSWAGSSVGFKDLNKKFPNAMDKFNEASRLQAGGAQGITKGGNVQPGDILASYNPKKSKTDTSAYHIEAMNASGKVVGTNPTKNGMIARSVGESIKGKQYFVYKGVTEYSKAMQGKVDVNAPDMNTSPGPMEDSSEKAKRFSRVIIDLRSKIRAAELAAELAKLRSTRIGYRWQITQIENEGIARKKELIQGAEDEIQNEKESIRDKISSEKIKSSASKAIWSEFNKWAKVVNKRRDAELNKSAEETERKKKISNDQFELDSIKYGNSINSDYRKAYNEQIDIKSTTSSSKFDIIKNEAEDHKASNEEVYNQALIGRQEKISQGFADNPSELAKIISTYELNISNLVAGTTKKLKEQAVEIYIAQEESANAALKSYSDYSSSYTEITNGTYKQRKKAIDELTASELSAKIAEINAFRLTADFKKLSTEERTHYEDKAATDLAQIGLNNYKANRDLTIATYTSEKESFANIRRSSFETNRDIILNADSSFKSRARMDNEETKLQLTELNERKAQYELNAVAQGESELKQKNQMVAFSIERKKILLSDSQMKRALAKEEIDSYVDLLELPRAKMVEIRREMIDKGIIFGKEAIDSERQNIKDLMAPALEFTGKIKEGFRGATNDLISGKGSIKDFATKISDANRQATADYITDELIMPKLGPMFETADQKRVRKELEANLKNYNDRAALLQVESLAIDTYKSATDKFAESAQKVYDAATLFTGTGIDPSIPNIPGAPAKFPGSSKPSTFIDVSSFDKPFSAPVELSGPSKPWQPFPSLSGIFGGPDGSNSSVEAKTDSSGSIPVLLSVADSISSLSNFASSSKSTMTPLGMSGAMQIAMNSPGSTMTSSGLGQALSTVFSSLASLAPQSGAGAGVGAGGLLNLLGFGEPQSGGSTGGVSNLLGFGKPQSGGSTGGVSNLLGFGKAGAGAGGAGGAGASGAAGASVGAAIQGVNTVLGGFASGMSKGTTTKSVASDLLTGFMTGGPMGAVMALGGNLIGGLFKKKPKPVPKEYESMQTPEDVLWASKKHIQGAAEGGREGLPISMRGATGAGISLSSNSNVNIARIEIVSNDPLGAGLQFANGLLAGGGDVSNILNGNSSRR